MRKAIIATVFPAILLALYSVACTRAPEQMTVQTVSTTNGITISDIRFYSPAIDSGLWYRIIVPSTRGERLPVLYLLHGANSSPVEITERSEVAQLAATEHLAVVIPDGKYSYYTNAKHKRNARWEDAITRDLMEDVRGLMFSDLAGSRTHRDCRDFDGGHGVAKLSLKHPDLYGFTGVISGVLDITRRPASWHRWGQTFRIWTTFGLRRSARRDEDVFDLLGDSKQLPQATWFISCGEIDPLHAAGMRFARLMRQHGMELNLITTQGGHDWQSWNAAMPQMFRSAGNALR